MKTNNRLLYVYGYTNDDEKYENQNTDMKIYLSLNYNFYSEKTIYKTDYINLETSLFISNINE